MDLTIIVLNFVYAVPGVAVMFLAYRVIDKLTPEVNFSAGATRTSRLLISMRWWIATVTRRG